MLKHIDLFAGIGGFSLGLEATKGFETVAFCEIEDYPRKVLNKHWPDISIARDVTKLTYNRESQELQDDGITIYRGRIDSMSGGFPCQDISVAGKQEGIEGERSGLWSECARLLGEVRPDYAIFENVTALISGEQGRWFQRVLFDISEVGYDAEWHCIPASELGAHHHRDRVWIIAYPNNNGPSTTKERKSIDEGGDSSEARKGKTSKSERLCTTGINEDVADSKRGRQQGQGKYEQSLFTEAFEHRQTVNALPGGSSDIWKVESKLGRVADGIPNRSHRLKGLGNAVVPQIPEIIGNAILRNNPC